MPDIYSLKEESFSFGSSFRSFSPCLAGSNTENSLVEGSAAEERGSRHGTQEAEREERSREGEIPF